jgi:hypothetical protein
MANLLYTKGAYLLTLQDIDWSTDDIRIMLLKDSYVFAYTHNMVSDIVASECDASNYVRKTIAFTQVNENDTDKRGEVVHADPSTWTSLGGVTNNTLGGYAVFRWNGSDATSELIGFVDTVVTDTYPIFPFETQGGDFSVDLNNTTGWLHLLADPT